MRKSFTLIELMIVVAIIAIIAAIAIPGLLRARISSNETSAIGSLRTTSTSQNQFQNAGVKDRDLDGVGEYGFYTELSGVADVPTGTSTGSKAKPAFVSTVFGATSSSSSGLANKSGYNFIMYLPTGVALGALAEDGAIVPAGAAIPAPADTAEYNAQETRWATYAWPTSAGNSGNKAFYVNQSGEVIATSNIPTGTSTLLYTGATTTPAAVDIYDTSDDDGDLVGSIITGTPHILGLIWNPTS